MILKPECPVYLCSGQRPPGRPDRELLMDCETLVGLDHQQRLMVLTPADIETRERLELPQVLGLQEFSRTYETSPPDGDVADRQFPKEP